MTSHGALISAVKLVPNRELRDEMSPFGRTHQVLAHPRDNAGTVKSSKPIPNSSVEFGDLSHPKRPIRMMMVAAACPGRMAYKVAWPYLNLELEGLQTRRDGIWN